LLTHNHPNERFDLDADGFLIFYDCTLPVVQIKKDVESFAKQLGRVGRLDVCVLVSGRVVVDEVVEFGASIGLTKHYQVKISQLVCEPSQLEKNVTESVCAVVAAIRKANPNLGSELQRKPKKQNKCTIC
jgi:hypothetical protein